MSQFVVFHSSRCALSRYCIEEITREKSFGGRFEFVSLDGVPRAQIPPFVKFLPCVLHIRERTTVQGNDVLPWVHSLKLRATTEITGQSNQTGDGLPPRAIPQSQGRQQQQSAPPQATAIADFDPFAGNYAVNSNDDSDYTKASAPAMRTFTGFSEFDCDASGVCRPKGQAAERQARDDALQQLQSQRDKELGEFNQMPRPHSTVLEPDSRYMQARERTSFNPSDRFELQKQERHQYPAQMSSGNASSSAIQSQNTRTRGNPMKTIEQLNAERQQNIYD